MEIGHVKALEMRAAWLREVRSGMSRTDTPRDIAQTLPGYEHVLAHGDTFYMDQHFCRLAQHAAESIPPDVKFDPTWMLAPAGWLWIDKPVPVDNTVNPDHKLFLEAIGWDVDPRGPGTVFMTFCTNMTFGIGLRIPHNSPTPLAQAIDGMKTYVSGRTSGDEIRWIYAAFYLMAQKLAAHVRHEPDRAQRRRAEEENRPTPQFVRVITLRRLEEGKRDPNHVPQAVDWQWQWEVVGHWRNQYHPSTGEHVKTWVESYIKGPEDKPFKNPGAKIFVARR